jgi:effector-binding domain-containing protein
VELIQPPRFVDRPDLSYLGIRLVTPFRGFLAQRDALLKELTGWLRERDIADIGPFFLRLNVVDMDGDMDIEVGAITPAAQPGDGRVLAGTLPAGRYATLTYRDHALRANRALLEWIAGEGIELDRVTRPEGDHFACRYEAYRTDPRTEPRKTKWEVELNIRVVA